METPIKLDQAISYFVEKTKTEPVKYAPILAELTRFSSRPAGNREDIDPRRLRNIIMRSEAMNRRANQNNSDQAWQTILQDLTTAPQQSEEPQQ